MKLNRLESVLRDERSTDQLQPLQDKFYTDAEQYINQLRGEREEAAENADNMFDSPEVKNLTYKIQTAEQTLESLYNRRVNKVVNQALLASTGGDFDTEPLTTQEENLYLEIIEGIKANRAKTLRVLASPNDSLPPMAGSEPESTGTVEDLANDTGNNTESESTEASASEFMSGSDTTSELSSDSSPETDEDADTGSTTSTESTGGFASGVSFGNDSEEDETNNADSEPPSKDDFTDSFDDDREDENTPTKTDGGTPDIKENIDDDLKRITVKVTNDVGEIFGVDSRTYSLAEDDVVKLPETNAKPLIEREAAIPLD